MAAGGHFEKNILKKSCVLIWNGEKCDQKWFSVIQNGPNRTSKMAAGGHFENKIPKNKSCALIWNGEKCIRKWFSFIQNGRRQPFCDFFLENQSCLLIWNGEKCDQKWFSVIQNGRRQPFCEKKSKLRIDLKWWEMRSKVIFGHPKWPLAAILWKKIKAAYWCEMARNAIESDFHSSKIAAAGEKKLKLRIDLKWREMRSKVIFGHPKWPAAILWKNKKLRIDLKWWEMRSKVIFGHPKWLLAAILWKTKVAYWSELARNAIKSDFRSSKMVAGSHFVKKKRVVYWCEMARNAIESDFRSSKMAAGSHFVKKLHISLKWQIHQFYFFHKLPPINFLKKVNSNEFFLKK